MLAASKQLRLGMTCLLQSLTTLMIATSISKRQAMEMITTCCCGAASQLNDLPLLQQRINSCAASLSHLQGESQEH